MQMKWLIVSDSSCDIRTLDDLAPGVEFGLVPFKINIGSKEFVDLPGLDTAAMLQAMTEHEGASTSACPSPGEWAAWFEKADNVIALTISSNLSGSYAAAMAARDIVLEASPNKKIFVLDTLRARILTPYAKPSRNSTTPATSCSPCPALKIW